jgi:hypothetical protein
MPSSAESGLGNHDIHMASGVLHNASLSLWLWEVIKNCISMRRKKKNPPNAGHFIHDEIFPVDSLFIFFMPGTK